MKYKVGDLVQLLRGYNKGSVGRIKAVIPNVPYAYKVNNSFYMEDELKKVVELQIKATVLGVTFNPKSCRDCYIFCRCGMCIPCDSAKVEDYWNNNTKPEWCPLMEEDTDVAH